MNFKALVSPLALASALALTGGALAQEVTTEAEVAGDMMLGNQSVSEDDLVVVQNFCADLSREDSRSELGGVSTGMSAEGDTTIEEDAASNVNDTFTTINFDTVTLEQCEEGGFLDEMMVEGEAEMEVEAEVEVAPQG